MKSRFVIMYSGLLETDNFQGLSVQEFIADNVANEMAALVDALQEIGLEIELSIEDGAGALS